MSIYLINDIVQIVESIKINISYVSYIVKQLFSVNKTNICKCIKIEIPLHLEIWLYKVLAQMIAIKCTSRYYNIAELCEIRIHHSGISQNRFSENEIYSSAESLFRIQYSLDKEVKMVIVTWRIIIVNIFVY